MQRRRTFPVIACFILLWLASRSGIAAEQVMVPLASGDEITVEHYPAEGKFLMLWFAPEYGLREAHRSLAGDLSKQHIEVWLTNLVDSLFMPNGTHSIRQLDGQHVAEMIAYAHKKTGKKIIVAGDSYASVIALTGARRWQEKQVAAPYLVGAILFSPYTYASIPPLGQLPSYLPIVSATNIPIMIYQAQNSAIIGQFDTLTSKLRQHGSPVYTRFIPGVMSLFYQPEVTVQMKREAKRIPANIYKMLNLLEKSPLPGKPIPLPAGSHNASGIDIQLKPFRGNAQPVAIKLRDTQGNIISKPGFKGKVTVINFWATWCPPCIREIPSLNRLKQKMQGMPFELISINYAEEEASIKDFMRQVHVNFPVLLDHDGAFAQRWKVISYPSTFIIDPEGNIRYGVNAAIEWDNPEVIARIKSLF